MRPGAQCPLVICFSLFLPQLVSDNWISFPNPFCWSIRPVLFKASSPSWEREVECIPWQGLFCVFFKLNFLRSLGGTCDSITSTSAGGANGNLHSFVTHKICAQSLRQVPQMSSVFSCLISLFAYETRIRQDFKYSQKIISLTHNPVQHCREAFVPPCFQAKQGNTLKKKILYK